MTALSHIHIDDVSKIFRSASGDDVVALAPVRTDIREGEFVSIVGPSGCGKSTLLNIIAGFEQATTGQVRVRDRVVSRPAADRGVVFQQYALFPWLTVQGNVAFGPQSIGLDTAEVRRRVAEGIRLVGLEGFERKYPHELSGGMRQRCALARCIANDPDILLMDEPLAALDAMTRETLQDELLRIWGEASRSKNKTVVYITHSIEEAIFLSDRIFVMSPRPGRIKKILDVRLPRPRKVSIRLSQEFHELHNKIWMLLHGEEK